MRENNSVNPSSKIVFRKCILNNSLAKTCFPKYFLMRQIMFIFFLYILLNRPKRRIMASLSGSSQSDSSGADQTSSQGQKGD